jgi:cyanophycinase
LFLIGGAEDRSGERVILRRVVEAARGRGVVVVTTASDYPVELGKDYLRVFRALGVADPRVLDIRRREEAEEAEAIGVVEGAGAVFFTGGDQVQLIQVFQGTALLKAVRRLHRDGAAVAGTSAGAAAAGAVTIYEGEAVGLVKGAVKNCPAFGFLAETIVDTHFMERGRMARLAQALAAGLTRGGVGLSENTAVLAGPDGTMEVLGSGVVAVLRSADGFASDHTDRAPGSLVSVDGIRLSFFAAGRRFILDRPGRPQPPAGMERPGRSGLGRLFKFLEPWHEYDDQTDRRS